MEALFVLTLLLVVGSTIWVGLDAWSLGARSSLRTGIVDLGPVGWVIACLAMWIIAFPLYLATRGSIKRAIEKEEAGKRHLMAMESQAHPSPSAEGSAGACPHSDHSEHWARTREVGYQPERSPRIHEERGSEEPQPRYWVQHGGKEFGPFPVDRLQEFVGTGQVKHDSPVRRPDGAVVPAERVPGLHFPQRQVQHRAESGAPSQSSPPPSPSASYRVQPHPVSTVDGPSVGGSPVGGSPVGGPSVGGPPIGGSPVGGALTTSTGGSGATAGALVLLSLIAGLLLLSVVLRHTVPAPGPVDKWEYKAVSPADDRFVPELDLLGGEGWELVFCRRAATSTRSEEREVEYRYECVMKKRQR